MVKLILDSSKSGPKTDGCDGRMVGDGSGELTSGSKSNIPLGVPSETCPSETLLAGDFLGGLTFGLVGWGEETINGGLVGVFYNYGEDDGGGIKGFPKNGTKTIRVSVTNIVMVYVGCGMLITCGGGGG